ncbi:MAG: SRPBCC family protein [Actinomycetales bacterium]|nr:SRPBCC family protein [Actinomycetales bacterium]
MSLTGDVLTVQRVIPASPVAIFDLLADPARHVDIDGSGTLKAARSGGRRLTLGDSFGMDMKLGVAYSTRNVVVEFDENRRIAWQTLAAAPLDRLITGRIWRYELQPVEGGTLVKQSWDLRKEGPLSKLAVRRMAPMTERNMNRTLERIAELLTTA